MQANISLVIHLSNKLFADPRRIRLLLAIEETGSISRGARLAEISYKTAWDAIDAMNTLAEQTIVERVAGGKGGGGAHLTVYGRRMLRLYQLLEQIQQKAFDVLQEDNQPLNSLPGAISRFSLQTSARNQLSGTVADRHSDGVLETITVLLSDKHTRVQVTITHGSGERLQIMPDKEVLVLIKAPWLKVHPRPAGEENQFPVTISAITPGHTGTEVLMQLANGETLCATLPPGETNFTEGQPAWASFDAANALLASLN
ncbi:DNA-binding/molybdate-binding domain-containing protein [Tatumella ptyseos ATCC 33301]|uniref:DNA-binding/molybdate-binding domain-containing protein n=1 Tax=Tatumella ptyseos ATCC 33301 TaxID=1005995 RepID=A0A085JC90_9GAMM|nr:TOBE domain-containing protein [Tatumella ptyseos]KFD18086.1 DNA-binding/molybdate-binding domain-containing protein [Tatumella ptyseos ATCC 33301]